MTKKGQIAFLNFILLLVALFVLFVIVAPVIKPFIDEGVTTVTDTTQLFLFKSVIFLISGFVILIGIKSIRDRQMTGQWKQNH